jgi:hypothetical protein
MQSLLQPSMGDQLLWFETLLKGVIGLVMLLFPVSAARLAGLPHAASAAIWARLFGTALIGIAGAFAVEGYNQAGGAIAAKGLGLGGGVIINLSALLSLFGILIFGAVSTWRGRVLIWLFIVLLLFLTVLEIAHV